MISNIVLNLRVSFNAISIDQFRCLDFYEKLIKFYASEDLPPKEDVFKLHCRDFVNRHAISDVHYQNEVGKGLYLDLCKFLLKYQVCF